MSQVELKQAMRYGFSTGLVPLYSPDNVADNTSLLVWFSIVAQAH
jgi:hypothetical protein